MYPNSNNKQPNTPSTPQSQNPTSTPHQEAPSWKFAPPDVDYVARAGVANPGYHGSGVVHQIYQPQPLLASQMAPIYPPAAEFPMPPQVPLPGNFAPQPVPVDPSYHMNPSFIPPANTYGYPMPGIPVPNNKVQYNNQWNMNLGKSEGFRGNVSGQDQTNNQAMVNSSFTQNMNSNSQGTSSSNQSTSSSNQIMNSNNQYITPSYPIMSSSNQGNSSGNLPVTSGNSAVGSSSQNLSSVTQNFNSGNQTATQEIHTRKEDQKQSSAGKSTINVNDGGEIQRQNNSEEIAMDTTISNKSQLQNKNDELMDSSHDNEDKEVNKDKEVTKDVTPGNESHGQTANDELTMDTNTGSESQEQSKNDELSMDTTRDNESQALNKADELNKDTNHSNKSQVQKTNDELSMDISQNNESEGKSKSVQLPIETNSGTEDQEQNNSVTSTMDIDNVKENQEQIPETSQSTNNGNETKNQDCEENSDKSVKVSVVTAKNNDAAMTENGVLDDCASPEPENGPRRSHREKKPSEKMKEAVASGSAEIDNILLANNRAVAVKQVQQIDIVPSSDNIVAIPQNNLASTGIVQFDWTGITPEDYIYDEVDEKYHCTKCVYGSPRFDKIVEHHKAHIKNKWSCDICGKAFLKSCDMERHAKAHAYNRTRPKGLEHVAVQSRNAFPGLNPPAPNSVLTGSGDNYATASNFLDGSVKQSVYTMSTFRETNSQGKSTTTRWEATAFTVEKSTTNSPAAKAITLKSRKENPSSTRGVSSSKSNSNPANPNSNRNSMYSSQSQRASNNSIDEQDFMQHGSFLKLLMQEPMCNPTTGASTSSSSKGPWSGMLSRNSGTQDQYVANPGFSSSRHSQIGRGTTQIEHRSSEGTLPATMISPKIEHTPGRFHPYATGSHQQSNFPSQPSTSNAVVPTSSHGFRNNSHVGFPNILNSGVPQGIPMPQPFPQPSGLYRNMADNFSNAPAPPYFPMPIKREVIETTDDTRSARNANGNAYGASMVMEENSVTGGAYTSRMQSKVVVEKEGRAYERTETRHCSAPFDDNQMNRNNQFSQQQAEHDKMLYQMRQLVSSRTDQNRGSVSDDQTSPQLLSPSSSQLLSPNSSHSNSSFSPPTPFLPTLGNQVPNPQAPISPQTAGSRVLCCKICNYATKDPWHLEKHLLAHTKGSKTCRFCNKAFERPSDLARHEERHWMKPTENSQQISPPIAPSRERSLSPVKSLPTPLPAAITMPPPKTGPKPVTFFSCDICVSKFISLENLNEHKDREHGMFCVRLDLYAANFLYQTHIIKGEVTGKNEISLTFEAPSISEMTDAEEPVPNVSSIHDITSIFKRPIAKLSYSKDALMRKGEEVWIKDKQKSLPNSSISSSSSFSSTDTIQDNRNNPTKFPASRHPRNVRPVEAIFRCTKCNYATNVRSHWSEHQRAHQGRYVCKICGKAFLKTSDLTRHWVGHETIPGGQGIICDSCPFTSHDKHVLEAHMKGHYLVLSRPNRQLNKPTTPFLNLARVKIEGMKQKYFENTASNPTEPTANQMTDAMIFESLPESFCSDPASTPACAEQNNDSFLALLMSDSVPEQKFKSPSQTAPGPKTEPDPAVDELGNLGFLQLLLSDSVPEQRCESPSYAFCPTPDPAPDVDGKKNLGFLQLLLGDSLPGQDDVQPNPVESQPPHWTQPKAWPLRYKGGGNCRYCGTFFARKVMLDRHEEKHMMGQLGNQNFSLRSRLGAVNRSKKWNLSSQRPAAHNLQQQQLQKPQQLPVQPQLPPHLQPQPIPQRPAPPPETADSEDIGFECKYCGKEFSCQANLVNHEKLHNKGRALNVASLKAVSTGLSSTKRHVCKYCNKAFEKAGNLQNHMKFHLGLNDAPSNEPGECRFCGKIFTTNNYLREHIRLHTGETPHECQHCGKRFPIRQNLRRHLKIFHPGATPVKSQ